MDVDYPTREYELYLNKNVVILLKDERYFYGIMNSFDQYNSIALNFATERLFYENLFAEKRLGLISLRGESVIFIGICNPTFSSLKKVDYDFLKAKIAKTSNLY